MKTIFENEKDLLLGRSDAVLRISPFKIDTLKEVIPNYATLVFESKVERLKLKVLPKCNIQFGCLSMDDM